MITKLVTSYACKFSADAEQPKVNSLQNKLTAAKVGDCILALGVIGAGIAGIVCGGCSPDSITSILGYVGIGVGSIMLGFAIRNGKACQRKFDDHFDDRWEAEATRKSLTGGDYVVNWNSAYGISYNKAEATLVKGLGYDPDADALRQDGVGKDDPFLEDFSLRFGSNPYFARSESGG